MKKVLSLAILATVLILTQACSKEKKFDRMLYKNKGEWSIESMTYTLITQNENYEIDTVSAMVQNPGIFEFEDNNVGSFSFIINNAPHENAFSWNSVNETALTLTRNSETYDFFTGDTEYIGIAMTGEKTGKNKLTITGIEILEIEEYNGGYTKSELTATFTLEKK